MSPEWSRPERLDAIGEGERPVEIAADAAERRALAERFGLIAIDRLDAHLSIRREAAGIRVDGRVSAEVVQACSVTGAPVAATIDEPVALRFVEPAPMGEDEELSADAIDTIELEGSAIDLGEVAAETMALALDPFPRSPEAAEILARAGVISDEDAPRTGPLGGLKDLLSRGG